MNKSMNYEALENWVESVGGRIKAMVLLMKKTEWSDSKASKVLRGKYEPNLGKLDRKALCELTGIPESTLFPLGGNQGEDDGDDAA